VAFLCPSWA